MKRPHPSSNIVVPKVTVGAESSFLNFITLAESVALALNGVFWDSLDVLMGDVEDFDLLRAALESLTSVLGDCSCIQNQKSETLFNNNTTHKEMKVNIDSTILPPQHYHPVHLVQHHIERNSSCILEVIR